VRTTVTLDEDVEQQIRQRMRERGAGFKETLNDLLRRGLRSADAIEPYVTPTFALRAVPDVDLRKALSLAAALEDEETARELERST
jgi:hypothetical protein